MGENGTARGSAAGLENAGSASLLPVPSSQKKTRRPARFNQTEVARTIKALKKAGLEIAAVKFEPDGTVIVIPGTPEAVPSSAPNPWDGGDA
jgi:glutamate-1-semialdehyde aminotransferase